MRSVRQRAERVSNAGQEVVPNKGEIGVDKR